MAELRQRQKPAKVEVTKNEEGEEVIHPGGKIKHGGPIQVLRFLLVVVYFFSACCSYVSAIVSAGYTDSI
jgi:hypothetical protein